MSYFAFKLSMKLILYHMKWFANFIFAKFNANVPIAIEISVQFETKIEILKRLEICKFHIIFIIVYLIINNDKAYFPRTINNWDNCNN